MYQIGVPDRVPTWGIFPVEPHDLATASLPYFFGNRQRGLISRYQPVENIVEPLAHTDLPIGIPLGTHQFLFTLHQTHPTRSIATTTGTRKPESEHAMSPCIRLHTARSLLMSPHTCSAFRSCTRRVLQSSASDCKSSAVSCARTSGSERMSASSKHRATQAAARTR